MQYLDKCKNCEYRQEETCLKFEMGCNEASLKCDYDGFILSGEDLMTQDDFIFWNTFCR